MKQGINSFTDTISPIPSFYHKLGAGARVGREEGDYLGEGAKGRRPLALPHKDKVPGPLPRNQSLPPLTGQGALDRIIKNFTKSGS
jgi:hypothetical protein